MLLLNRFDVLSDLISGNRFDVLSDLISGPFYIVFCYLTFFGYWFWNSFYNCLKVPTSIADKSVRPDLQSLYAKIHSLVLLFLSF